jgi:hypothetical protein
MLTIIPVTTSPKTLTNSFSGGVWNKISRFYFDRNKFGQLQVEKKNLAHILPCEKVKNKFLPNKILMH